MIYTKDATIKIKKKLKLQLKLCTIKTNNNFWEQTIINTKLEHF